jgi:hypothetical protein
MSSIINSLSAEQLETIIAAYGTVLNWFETASSVVTEDIIM